GLARLPMSVRRWAAAGVIVSSLAFAFAYGDLPFSRKFDFTQFQPEPRYASFLPALNRIGPEDSVSAENGLASHLSERRLIYEYRFEGIQSARWVVLDYFASHRNQAVFDG